MFAVLSSRNISMANLKDVSLKDKFIIASTMLPLMIYIIISVNITDYARETSGALYAFRVNADWTILYMLLTIVMVGGLPLVVVSCIRNSVNKKWVIGLTIACLSYFIISLWVDSKSIGYVEETGIRYSSIRTCFNSEKIEWNEIGKRATLEIEIRRRKSSTLFIGELKLQANNGQPLPFDIIFDIKRARAYRALINVLNLLKEKNIQVITSIDDTTSGDKEGSRTLDEIKMLTEGK